MSAIRARLGSVGAGLPRRQTSRWYLVIPLAVAVLLSCHQLTDIDAPDVVEPGALDSPIGASTRYAGALADFAAAYANQVAETGLITDEFQNVGDSPESSDRRVILPTNSYPFSGLSRARVSAFRAIATLQRFAPDPPERIGEMYALLGFIEVMFAENMCSPIPLATVVDGTPASAPPFDRDALIEHALSMFDSAAANAAGSQTVANLTRVGRARALLLRGDTRGAAATVEFVPQDFNYRVQYSASVSGQTNTVYDRIAVGKYVSVSDREGVNGLPFITGADERVGAESIGLSRSGYPSFDFAKDGSLGASIVLASGVEAQLIRAEAALLDADVATWAGILDGLRQSAIAPPLSPLPDDSTTDASAELRLDVLFHERALWLFGTGHRQGDMRRLIRQYGRDPDATFPTGPYLPGSGARYGPDVAFIPWGEDPNTAYGGCVERGA